MDGQNLHYQKTKDGGNLQTQINVHVQAGKRITGHHWKELSYELPHGKNQERTSFSPTCFQLYGLLTTWTRLNKEQRPAGLACRARNRCETSPIACLPPGGEKDIICGHVTAMGLKGSQFTPKAQAETELQAYDYSHNPLYRFQKQQPRPTRIIIM